MLKTCRNCNRPLAAPAAGGLAAYCMYCGGRIEPETTDFPTKTYLPADIGELDSQTDVGPRPPPDPTSPPEFVGGYHLLRCLGSGGMGAVYEAESTDRATHVAVKLLSGQMANDPHAVERFKVEGRIASQITHPRCVFVIGAETDNGRPYIVMELMPGTTLKDLVEKQGPLPPALAVGHIMDVAEGLAEAHRHGVIHRDVKPSNCFLTAEGRIKVGDFGLAKSLVTDPAAGQLTQTGAFLGTVLFASPEQIRGEVVGYESDIYSACATLYYLLTGRAPHQHTSLTGALAKAISEPPTPVRTFRGDVSASLERLLLRGLDRSPARRWPTADDLRDALRDLMPAAHTTARLRSLAVTYLIDLLVLVVVFVIVLEQLAGAEAADWPFATGWVAFAITSVYFGTAEGWFGTSAGKQLLRLRVSRVGETGAPGLSRGLVRAFVFHACWFFGLTGFGAIFDGTITPIERIVGGGVAALGLACLAVQFRRTPHGFRGCHDRLTGCHVLQRPRPSERVRLVSRHPNPLDAAQPTPELPTAVSGFEVLGTLTELPNDAAVWVGKDRSLGRRVLIHVYPPGESPDMHPDHVATRPARLRVVDSGILPWKGSDRLWVACVAPAGAPLADVIDSGKPLDWADARSLLEQLVEELLAGDCDGTGIVQPSVDHVWVEPNGRLRILDVPVPPGRPAAVAQPADEPPTSFVRNVAALILEGQPRATVGPVQAPVPPHAAAVIDKLFTDPPEGYAALTDLQADLAATHAHSPRVTRAERAAHLSLQAAILTFGMLVLFVAAGFYSWESAFLTALDVSMLDNARTAVSDPQRRSIILADAATLPAGDPTRTWVEQSLSPEAIPDTLAQIEAQAEDMRAKSFLRRQQLTAPERLALDRITQTVGDEFLSLPPEDRLGIYSAMIQPNGQLPLMIHDPGRPLAWVLAAVVAGVPLVWAIFAFAFRGGFAMQIADIAVIRTNGRAASRSRCAIREILVWLPIVTLLMAGLWVQAVSGPVALRVLLWLAALGLLPIYFLIALRSPAQPPQDRLLGTVLVPA